MEAHPDNSLKLQQLMSYRISHLSNTISRAVSNELDRDYGIALTDYRILTVIAQNDSVSIKEITTLTRIDKGWISRSVNNLLKQGLLIKTPDDNDARKINLFLTDKGKQLQKTIYKGSIRRQEILLDKFTTGEKAMLFELLDQLMINSEKLLADSE